MGANTKQLRNRIKSVDSTLHLTKAMGLVASSKMRRALQGMKNGREYELAVKNAIDPLIGSTECASSPYMSQNEGKKQCLIVIAGDRGLAGGYNANIFRALREYEDTEIIAIGKRACDRFKQKPISAEQFDYQSARELSVKLCQGFKQGQYSRVGILCTKYVSMMTQEPHIKWMLPLQGGEQTKGTSVVFEPDELTVLDLAVPEYVAGMIVASVRESFASEIAARRNAMDSAGKNAQEMIDELSLEYNRARQGAITQEITEIVAGSGAQ